ncbi:pyridoxamine 5'-phosphate oxidase family protein [Nocardia blacklockiae]|uniref:pyridoxamine 5'-phosphate oxidase family protein n=1 Tax=Nocardia blacklockiae TaxID=480036 RepID=UPI001895C7FF|nr:pyridoxamine 5'-phosphate oxidase family protein [Nocardia blacklockiae]MBF6170214.1 pyridoxamine 5'-phosphate oxidase family protein [Nocardia blacklockiae]
MEETLGSRELSAVQSLQLLAGVRFGRVVFSRYALPTIRPVNHAVVDDTIVIYANPGTTLSADRQVVAYEADTIDHATLLGWCVIVTGAAEELTDRAEIDRCRRALPAVLPGPRDRIIRIHPDIVTGVEYLAASAVGNSDTVR